MIAAIIVTASIAALDAVTIKNNNQVQSILYYTDGYASANYLIIYRVYAGLQVVAGLVVVDGSSE